VVKVNKCRIHGKFSKIIIEKSKVIKKKIAVIGEDLWMLKRRVGMLEIKDKRIGI